MLIPGTNVQSLLNIQIAIPKTVLIVTIYILVVLLFCMHNMYRSEGLEILNNNAVILYTLGSCRMKNGGWE